MSFESTLLSVFGAVTGVLIPGAGCATTDLTHSVQQHVADVFGAAAVKLANELKLDATGMSGPDKVFAIKDAMVATAEAQGFKGDLKVLGATILDVAQAAYRASEPSIGADIMVLARAVNSAKLTAVASLVAPMIQRAADAALATTASPPATAS